ncbi:hypothetical protein AGMMS50276_30730 [Synergistales bacterium]|nr:hypothetical protein AGMMS50276_30730 [Synergistales bacterium]
MKTSLAVNAAIDYMTRSDDSCLFCQCDMPPWELAERLALRECGLSTDDFRRQLADGTEQALSATEAIKQKYNRLFITGNTPNEPMTLERLFQDVLAKGAGFVVIDYLTRLKPENTSDLIFTERVEPCWFAFAGQTSLTEGSKSSCYIEVIEMAIANTLEAVKARGLKPRAKGQSGNPSGRPKQNPEVVETLKAHSVEAAETLIELLTSKDENIRLKVAQVILDRTEGKPESTTSIALRNTASNSPVIFMWGTPPPKEGENTKVIDAEIVEAKGLEASHE